MSYFLRNVLREEEILGAATPDYDEKTTVATDFGALLRYCAPLPGKGHIFHLPTSEAAGETPVNDKRVMSTKLDSLISIVAVPSSFGIYAIARNIVLRYSQYLDNRESTLTTCVDTEEEVLRIGNIKDEKKEDVLDNCPPQTTMVSAGVECMLSVLWQLSRRDSELCVQALHALLVSLQHLRNSSTEPLTLLENTHETLIKLRLEGSPEVSSKAASCLAALAVSSFSPQFIFSTAACFLCDEPQDGGGDSSQGSSSQILMPENQHRLAMFIQQRANACTEQNDWWSHSLVDHSVIASFDLSSLPSDSSPETPDDDKRLNGAIASDGIYVYVLNYLGLYKIGTGLSESIAGKLYASNSMMKASRNCVLTFCNSSLYLRRGQSSRVWVLDTDSLRERGEIILQPGPSHSAIFSDGCTFYQAHLDQHSTFIINPLNDSFAPIPDQRQRQKLRLTRQSYSIYGDAKATPHNLPLSLPTTLHGQSSDLLMGKDVALLLARNGKVYYAGNGAKLGLQETNTTWMELVLPETIVQISVGSENVLFRSGSGHIWIAGAEDRKKVGKLRRLHTSGRKKAVSVAASGNCFAYVTENGRVFATGKHSWRAHPETGLVMGLDGIHVASVALGKSHAVAVSRHGQLYTWGLNNLGQCGRIEQPSAGSSPRHVNPSRQVTCSPNEHLWMRDVASLCVACGKCSSRGVACTKSAGIGPGSLCPCGPGETTCLRCGICRQCGESSSQQGEEMPYDDSTPRKIILGPARVFLQKNSTTDIKVSSVSCGNFHTILLAADRQVFTFGSNCNGQLGVGDTVRHLSPQRVSLPAGVQPVQVAAGANHCVIRTADGSVYTFGNNKSGQLAREGVEDNWNCKPEAVPGFGGNSGTTAGWIGASGDVTFIHAHTTLLDEEAVGNAQIVANKSALFIFPKQIGKEYIAVKRKQNTFIQHQLGAAGLYTSYALEPTYNIMWSYSAAEMRVTGQTEVRIDDAIKDNDQLRYLRCPELMIPEEPETVVSAKQLAINLLSSTYALTMVSNQQQSAQKDLSIYQSTPSLSDGRSVLARFEGNGGGWGYSAHSVDAIQFKTNVDIRLLGIGLYGGRGEYNAKVKLFRLMGVDGDELYVEQLTQTDEVIYECAPRDVASILLPRPILIRANLWHVVSVKISGPSSDCGAAGKPVVEGDGVTFTFRNSTLSNNGTDVTVGQIPELYYITPKTPSDVEEKLDQKALDQKLFEDMNRVRRSSLIQPAPSVFTSLFRILEWATDRVFQIVRLTEENLWERERAALVAILSLRIIRSYTQILYPTDRIEEPSPEMADCIVQLHRMINNIFYNAREKIEAESQPEVSQLSVLEECVSTYVGSSHVLLPSRTLVLTQLTNIMSSPRQGWPLTALLYSLANMQQILHMLVDLPQIKNPPPLYPMLCDKLSVEIPFNAEKTKAMMNIQNVLSFLFDLAFGRSSAEYGTCSLYSLESVARELIVTIAKELVKPEGMEDVPTMIQSPCRFRRRSGSAAWDMTTGAADAISIQVDKPGITLCGVGMYLSGTEHTTNYLFDILHCESDTGEEKWEVVEKATLMVVNEDSKEIALLKLLRPLPLEPSKIYAIRIVSNDGGKTFCGENGVNSLRLGNGTRVVFSTCALSENGTCVSRGQIPHIYYTTDEGNRTPKIDAEFTSKWFLSLLRLMTVKVNDALASGSMTCSARKLVSKISGYCMMFMESSPQRALEVLTIIDQLLPMVSSVNGIEKAADNVSRSISRSSAAERKVIQTEVESPHPYKSSCVHSVVCGFEKEVEFMYVEMEENSRTASADDILWIYIGIDRECYVPVAKFAGSCGWPRRQLMLPGNSLWFILESAGEVEGATDEDMYGFRCSVHGYPSGVKDSNILLEQELAWLSASACRLLVQIPNDADSITQLSIAEEETRDLLEKHGTLLRKGLNLGHVPTLHELYTRNIPAPTLTSELRFVKEFLAASSSTVAGMLSRWLPTGPVVDASNCQFFLGKEEFTVGTPSTIKVVTRDQFGRIAHCSQVTVEVSVKSATHTMEQDQQTVPPVSLFPQNPFVPVFMNKARYMSICMMPAYSKYSYEELRLGYCSQAFVNDNVVMTQKNASTHVGTWLPRVPGSFRVECRIDGFQVPHTYAIDVADNCEENSEKRIRTRVAQLSKARIGTISQFVSFKGIRIRSSPSLGGHKIGYIPRGSNVSYIEEVDNSDGKWLRLTDETATLHCEVQSPPQAWCLQYHRALDKQLIDIGNVDTINDVTERIAEEIEQDENKARRGSEQSVLIEANEMYILTEGDKVEIYSKPSLAAVIQDEYLEGRKEIMTDGWIHNTQGVWIRIAATGKYILAEDSIGRSSVHSQITNMNGNDEEEKPLRQLKPGNDVRSLRPSVVDCCRTVFAAFLWHEHLVKDAMAAATYLKFHQNLHNIWSACPDNPPYSVAPAPLQPVVKLWKDVCTAVQNSIEQHLIMPSPPSLRHFQNKNTTSSISEKQDGALCELCEERFKASITVHMRMAHTGCGSVCHGYGYNSSGKYTNGWTGNCGDGGRPGSTWYLMCPNCRAKYLKHTPSGHQLERTRRWRQFRMSTAAIETRPECVLKQNAAFLLELNPSVEGTESKNSSTNTSGWTINLFPTGAPTPPSYAGSGGGQQTLKDLKINQLATTSHQPRRESDPFLRVLGHTSDPGPKGEREDKMPTEILQSPSNALKSLISVSSSCSNGPSAMLKRPVLAFIIEHHDLKRVREASTAAVKRAVAFAHAFRVWNWLLRLVSTETSVSDVVFQYLWSLSSYSVLSPILPSPRTPVRLLPHPWRLCFLAGPLATSMVHHMHTFLYSIAVILQSNDVDSRLRSLCFKAWTIQLTAHEQDLLILTCNILATVGGVLSEPSADQFFMDDSEGEAILGPEACQAAIAQNAVDVKHMDDITSLTKIEASSRQAMVVCLSDGNVDTFWESGEEDKARSRIITIRCDTATPVLLAVYVDNIKDDQYRTASFTVRATLSSGVRKNIYEQTVDSQFVGWLKCCIAGMANTQIILKGPQPAQRVRQLYVFGFHVNSPVSPTRDIHPSPSHQLLFSSPQGDAFALFQAISSQAFSDELSEDQHGTLRQRVVDLLFSRVHLQPLQTYVCSQIVNALDREVAQLGERVKRNYSYACGLMAMLIQVCASRKGTEVFAARDHLLITLSQLLLFSPQVVQCQVLATIERLLPVFQPSQVDVGQLVTNLLVAIAKVVQLQVRDKVSKSVNTVKIATNCTGAPAHWRVDKALSQEVGRLTMHLFNDAVSDKMTPEWSIAFRKELASALFNIVHLSPDLSVSSSSTISRDLKEGSTDTIATVLKSKRFWLAIAALTIVKKPWLELVEGWRNIQAAKEDEPEPFCENHDDGRTFAQVHCNVCDLALCRDCFRTLHLSKRNRGHEAHLIGGSTTAPQVEIHEGCSRLRIHNILVLMHCSALSGMIELSLDSLFPSGSSLSLAARHSTTSAIPVAQTTGRCRFCSAQLSSEQQMTGVCSDEECRALQPLACEEVHPCGHLCGGVAGEKECLPCMRCSTDEHRQDGDDVCVVCLIDRLSAAPAVRLECSHVFHYHCLRNVLERRWNGPRILFRFIHCPLCNQQMAHPALNPLLEPLLELKKDVEMKAKMRLEYDGLQSCPAITNENSEYHNKPEEYAMDRYMYVLCFKCKKAYFGGESRCQQALDTSQYNPSELICGGCCNIAGAQMCGRHGIEYLEYKCRFCCSIAVYFCFGTTHFCAPCHDDFQRLMCLPKVLLPHCPVGPKCVQLEEGACPLRIQHAPTGEEFAMGCGICRNLSTF